MAFAAVQPTERPEWKKKKKGRSCKEKLARMGDGGDGRTGVGNLKAA